MVLIGIGLLAGFITAISPCVLPVLPILLAGGASGRKPLRIIAGLVTSFVVFTLFATWLLDKLGLPQDILRDLAIAMLFLLAATLLLPKLAELLERPFAGLTRFRAGGGGFFLGASLGLVFVPCAGPVLGVITASAGQYEFDRRVIVLMVAYAVGVAVPMLAITFGGRGVATRLRAQAQTLRVASGVMMAAVALGLVFHLDDRVANYVPGYVDFLQDKIEESSAAKRELAKLRGQEALTARGSADGLPDYGVAPALHPDGDWFNSEPLTLRQLRGKVVLVDFWTYSCINCLRTLPHLKGWDDDYRSEGLVIVGVHTPEFAFEHVGSNVEDAIERLGVRYPVVQDNRFRTWRAFSNQYWPAKYMIDRKGHIRYIHFGEGGYDETEMLLRRLLGVEGDVPEPAGPTIHDRTTPELYLGFERVSLYRGEPLRRNRYAAYAFPKSLPLDSFSYAGRWRVDGERIVAGAGARLRLHFKASDVFLVLGGKGEVAVHVDGKPTTTVKVDSHRLYTLREGPDLRDGELELAFTPGVQAYAFTFG